MTTPAPRPRVLVVDDDPLVLRAMLQILAPCPVTLESATRCAEARLSLLQHPETAVILCDHLLPDGTGVDLLREIKTEHPSLVRILITGAHVFDQNIALQAVNSGEVYRFLGKPFAADELRGALLQALDRYRLQAENLRLHEQLELRRRELEEANARLEDRVEVETGVAEHLRGEAANWRRAFHEAVDLARHLVERLDRPLHQHGERVAAMAGGIAQELGFPDARRRQVLLAATLHDLGLLGSDPVWRAHQTQPAGTPAIEREWLLQHPRVAAELLDFWPDREVVTAIALHHERLDGSGYPEGRAGEQIPELARLVALADAWDETGGSTESRLARFEAEAGRLWDADHVRALDRLLRRGEPTGPRDRPVLVRELVPGMRLASAVFTSSGMLLLRQGQVLNSNLIQKLRQHDVLNHLPAQLLVEA